MLKSIHIKNFKSLKNESIALKNITIFTGPNSSGKSTALLAILLAYYENIPDEEIKNYIEAHKGKALSFDEPVSSLVEIITKDDINKNYGITIELDRIINIINENETPARNMYFICADRIGPRNTYDIPLKDRLDIYGRYSVSFLEKNKNKPLATELIHKKSILETLGGQVNYWLQYIVDTEIRTSKKSEYTDAMYSHSGEEYISPLATGFGTSTLLPIIIQCLSATPGDIIIIENPEVHLHPQAQSKLADFFAFIVNAGIQIIIETHCEHLIYNLCYNVNKRYIDKNNIVLHYKPDNKKAFVNIYTDENGRFIDKNGEHTSFPSGFFDATLQKYLSIYR